jgi:hypothetical protein
MDPVVPIVRFPKSKYGSKLKVINLVLFASSNPMDPSHISVLLKITSSIELIDDLIVPIIFEAHYFVQCFALHCATISLKIGSCISSNLSNPHIESEQPCISC